MYGRVTILEGSPEQLEEGTEYVRTTILPAAKQIDGFLGMLNLADPGSGKGMTITLWESEDAMRESEEKANRLRNEAAQALGANVAGVERYEVTFSEIGAAAGV